MRVIVRGQADQQRADAHQHQRIDHRVLAAVDVGDIAEDVGADRTDDDAETVDADRGGNRGKTRQLEEHAAPDRRRDHAGDQEVVLFDHRADDGRQCDFINLSGGRSCGRSCGGVTHSSSPQFTISIAARSAGHDRKRITKPSAKDYRPNSSRKQAVSARRPARCRRSRCRSRTGRHRSSAATT